MNTLDRLAEALRLHAATIAYLQRTTNPEEWATHGDWAALNRASAEALAAYDAEQAAPAAGAHTAEPWRLVHNHVASESQTLAIVTGRDYEPNARRIVACVNACAGVPTELLESLPTATVTEVAHVVVLMAHSQEAR